MNGDSKAKIEIESQRFNIINHSIYGFWIDQSNSIEFKISPLGPKTRIKIVNVSDPTILERISFYCGLQVIPKRTKWKGFDFITQLGKANQFFYKEGIVHMPNTSRKNLVNLNVTNTHQISLDFFFLEVKQKQELQKYVGTMILNKSKIATKRS